MPCGLYLQQEQYQIPLVSNWILAKSIKGISEVCNLFCQQSKKYLDFYAFSSGFVDLGSVPFCHMYSSFFPYQG